MGRLLGVTLLVAGCAAAEAAFPAAGVDTPIFANIGGPVSAVGGDPLFPSLDTGTRTVAPPPTIVITVTDTDVLVSTSTTSTTSALPEVTAPPTTTEAPLDVEALLTASYRWGYSEEAFLLQQFLQVSADGWYGPQTRAAHLSYLAAQGWPVEGVPAVPPPPVVVPVVDPEAPTLELECQEMACWPGYTGDHQPAVNEAVAGVPSVLVPGLAGVQIVNGCWPGAAHFDLPDDCSVNVFDEWGWYADGSHGNPWANAIWITNSTAAGPGLAYVALHEVAHAYSMQVLDVCYDPDGTTYQTRLYALMNEPQFEGTNPEELLADVIAGYFGHPYTNYRGQTPISEAQSALLTEAFAACS